MLNYLATIQQAFKALSTYVEYYSEVPNKSVTFLILFRNFFPTYMALLGPTRLFIFGKSCCYHMDPLSYDTLLANLAFNWTPTFWLSSFSTF